MFTGLMDKDGDHDGIMNISEFEEAVRLCLGFKFDGEFMGYINRRYAEYRDERINILSFLYDLYSIRRTQPKETAIGQFSDFPIFKRREDGKVMVDFVRMMQTKHITSEQLAADLIALCRSNRIKTSAIMLKVIHIMEDDIFNTPGANGSSRRDQADPDGKGPESPLARIFEVIDYINDLEKVPQVSGYLKSSGVDLSKSTNDQDKLLQMSGVPRGNVMDYTLVRYLNSYMKYNMRILLKELIEDMRRKTLDLKSYITECIDSQDIVNLGQFYEFLSRQKHGSGGIDQLFEALGVTRTTKLPLPKFQIKLEREITLLNVLDDVDEVKEVIYGQEGQKLDAVELGVSNIVDKINQGLKMQQKTFGQIFYGSGNVQTIDKSQLERILLSMGIRDTAEVQRLMSVCRNRKVANTFNLKTLRRLCDSRSLDGQGDGRNTEEQLNLTIQNLKKTINSMGVNFSALFTKVDTNSNNTLDQRVVSNHRRSCFSCCTSWTTRSLRGSRT
jgi:hypothetical protein